VQVVATARDGTTQATGRHRRFFSDRSRDAGHEPFPLDGRPNAGNFQEPLMSVKSVVLIAAAAALSSAVVAANIARSGAVAPDQAKVDFDQTFAAAGASAEVVSTKLDAEQLRRAGLKRIDLTR
jgi:hypothetical protein